jgi:diamine N-acetyltransferase
MRLTLDRVTQEPDTIASRDSIHGVEVVFRPLQAGDEMVLGDYFERLSPDTRKRFAPHPFTRQTAGELCSCINCHDKLRLIAVTGDSADMRMVAYFILDFAITADDQARFHSYGMLLDRNDACRLAPSVADEYQNQGLGSLLMARAIAIAGRFGCRQIILLGGTQATNERAIHFYRKFGFEEVGHFWSTDGQGNYDMVLRLH